MSKSEHKSPSQRRPLPSRGTALVFTETVLLDEAWDYGRLVRVPEGCLGVVHGIDHPSTVARGFTMGSALLVTLNSGRTVRCGIYSGHPTYLASAKAGKVG